MTGRPGAGDGEGRSPRTWLGRRPVAAFFLIAYAWSWGLFVLLRAVLGPEELAGSRLWHVPFAWGPPLGAIAACRLAGGDPWGWLRRVANPRTGARWYLAAFALGLLFSNTRPLLAGLSGVGLALAAPVGEVLASFFLTLLLAGSLEEFGWRGFAQLRLQERHGALLAAAIVGVGFGLWHLPWLLLGGAGYDAGGAGAVVGLTLFAVLASVIFAWLFNGSGGAVPVVMLGHASINVGTILEPAGEVPGWLPETQLGLFLWVGLALLLVLRYGHRDLAPRRPGVPGGGDAPPGDGSG